MIRAADHVGPCPLTPPRPSPNIGEGEKHAIPRPGSDAIDAAFLLCHPGAPQNSARPRIVAGSGASCAARCLGAIEGQKKHRLAAVFSCAWRSGLVLWLVGELLAADGDAGHEAALDDGEDGDAVLEGAGRGRVRLVGARAR